MRIKSNTLMPICIGLLTLFCNQVWGAAKPVTGVSCQEGFFILTPDKHIYWINDEKKEQTLVYSQNETIYAMAECGTGVITVFEKTALQKPQYTAYYSPNCKSIGTEHDETRNIYQGDIKINQIRSGSNKLQIRLANNQFLSGSSCSHVTLQRQ